MGSRCLAAVLSDWTPPRVVIVGPLVITLEVHTPYVEYGAQAWDPVDDIWYPEWKDYDGVDDDLDDGIVRITGHVDYHNVGVYYIYYDATDLHGNDARQQVRTIRGKCRKLYRRAGGWVFGCDEEQAPRRRYHARVV